MYQSLPSWKQCDEKMLCPTNSCFTGSDMLCGVLGKTKFSQGYFLHYWKNAKVLMHLLQPAGCFPFPWLISRAQTLTEGQIHTDGQHCFYNLDRWCRMYLKIRISWFPVVCKRAMVQYDTDLKMYKWKIFTCNCMQGNKLFNYWHTRKPHEVDFMEQYITLIKDTLTFIMKKILMNEKSIIVCNCKVNN